MNSPFSILPGTRLPRLALGVGGNLQFDLHGPANALARLVRSESLQEPVQWVEEASLQLGNGTAVYEIENDGSPKARFYRADLVSGTMGPGSP